MGHTIEERAQSNANEYCLIKHTDSWYIRYAAYRDGATEQREIDIDKACEWLEDELCHYDDINGIAFVERFRKAMEE